MSDGHAVNGGGGVWWTLVAWCSGESCVTGEAVDDMNGGEIMMTETFKHVFHWLILLPIVWAFIVWRIYVGVFRCISKADEPAGVIEGSAEFQQTIRFVVKFRKGRRLPQVLCKVVGDVRPLPRSADVNDVTVGGDGEPVGLD